MLQLGFARSLAGLFTADESSQKDLTILFVILAVFFIDFSVNAINALDRALLLDLVDSSQQSIANAWSARLSGLGAIIGFFIGQADVTKWIPFSWFTSLSASAPGQLDTTEAQLRCVCIMVVFLLLGTHCVTILTANEKAGSSIPSASRSNQSRWKVIMSLVRQTIRDLFVTAHKLSRPFWEIFRIQFFLWIAWFPVREYTEPLGVDTGKVTN
jgi:solute carrier family 45 protein 1/2/4